MAKKRGSPSNVDAPEDAFTARILRFWAWARQNTQVLVVAGVLLAVAVGAGIYYYDYRQNLRIQAAQELEQIRQMAGSEGTEAARSELETFVERYSDTAYGIEARILLAELHLEAEAPEDAAGVLEPATRNLSDPLALQAGFLLGVAYEEAGRTDEAENLYLRLAENAELRFQIRQALAEAARIRAREGRYAEAADLYERVLATYDDESEEAVDDSERRTYRLRLSEMRAAARQQP